MKTFKIGDEIYRESVGDYALILEEQSSGCFLCETYEIDEDGKK